MTAASQYFKLLIASRNLKENLSLVAEDCSDPLAVENVVGIAAFLINAAGVMANAIHDFGRGDTEETMSGLEYFRYAMEVMTEQANIFIKELETHCDVASGEYSGPAQEIISDLFKKGKR